MLSACLIICCLLVSLVCVGAHDSWNCAAVWCAGAVSFSSGSFPDHLCLIPRLEFCYTTVLLQCCYMPITRVLLLCIGSWVPCLNHVGSKVALLLLEKIDVSNFSHRSTNFEPSQLWPATGFSVQILEVFMIAWLRLPTSFSLNGMLHYSSPFHSRRASMSVWRISCHSTTLQSMLAVTWPETRPSLLQPEMDTGRWARDQLLIPLLVPTSYSGCCPYWVENNVATFHIVVAFMLCYDVTCRHMITSCVILQVSDRNILQWIL